MKLFHRDSTLVETKYRARVRFYKHNGLLSVYPVSIARLVTIREDYLIGRSEYNTKARRMDNQDHLYFKQRLLPDHETSRYKNDFPYMRLVKQVFTPMDIAIKDYDETSLFIDIIVNPANEQVSVENIKISNDNPRFAKLGIFQQAIVDAVNAFIINPHGFDSVKDVDGAAAVIEEYLAKVYKENLA